MAVTRWGPNGSFTLGQQSNNTTKPQVAASQANGGVMGPINPINLDAGVSARAAPGTVARDSTFAGAPELVEILAGSNPDTLTANKRVDNNSFDAKLRALGVNFNPAENPLNIYASCSYHIRFFMASEGTSYNTGINPSNPNTDAMDKVIIAESGVTAGFNITSLRMETSAGADRKKRNMWFGTDYTLIITESMGLSLIDRMFNASRDLGMRNYVRGPYWLEIWFTGYDEDGNITVLSDYHYLYRVIIRDISVNFGHVGAEYTILLADDGVTGEMNQMSTPPTQLQISAITLGEFYKKLEQQWNDSSARINADKLARTVYKIQYPPVFDSWPLKNVTTSQQNARNTDMSVVVDGPNTVISIPKGQSIENIVNFVSYLTTESLKWLTGTGSVGPSGASLADQGMVRYVAVYPEMKLLGYDTRLRDYVREITYNLVPTETIRAYTDMTSVNALSTAEITRNKLQYMANNNRLRKRYDYIYTGKNTEVIRFDATLDNYWAVALPIWDQMTDYNQWTIGPQASQGSVSFQKAKGTFIKDQVLADTQINEPDAQPSSMGTSFNGSQSLVDESTGRAALQERALEKSAGLSFNGPTTPTSASRSSSNEILFNNLSPGAAALDTIASNQDAGIGSVVPELLSIGQTRAKARYLEDVNRQLVNWSDDPLPVAGMFDTRPYFMNAVQSADQNKIMSATNDPTAWPPGTPYAANILSNIFEQNFFLDIEIEIRGDPWWLPLSNLLQNQIAGANATSNGAATAGPTGLSSATYIGGDNAIVFEMRLGVEIDEDTGLADLSQSLFYNGVYQVLDVKNDFVNGKFTQILHCSKDVLEQVGQQVRNVGPAVAAGTLPTPTNNVGAPTPGFGGPR